MYWPQRYEEEWGEEEYSDNEEFNEEREADQADEYKPKYQEFRSEFFHRISHYPLIEYLTNTGYEYYNEWKTSNSMLKVNN